MIRTLGVLYPRCCEGATAAVNSDGQAYDSKGYCTIPASAGGFPGATCQQEWIPGFSNTTLMLAGGALLLLILLTGRR